ncbi:MAG: PAS domain-containing protein [Chloroflexi bacterium]|nr:PAS domain-containing protein [Chloroflexota bacterium]
MSWDLAIATALLFVSATLLAVVGAIAWRYRSAPSAKTTAVVVWLGCVWSLGYAGELISTDLALKLSFAKFQYVAIASIPATWLMLVLQYTERERWIVPWKAGLLGVVPLLTVLLVWTTESHGLVWRTMTLDLRGSFPILAITYGPWFWLHVVYSYLLFVTGMLILVSELQGASRLSREHIAALLVSSLAPIAANVLYLAGLTPVPHLDLTPYAFLVSGVALLWGLFHSQFLDLVPVARDRVVESMTDGFLVLSRNNRVVDINAAAVKVLGKPQSEVLGQPLASVLDISLALPGELGNGVHPSSEVTLGSGEAQQVYETHVSPLTDSKGRLRGHVVLLSDITEKKHTQLALEDTIKRKDIAYQQALIYSNALNQEIRARNSAEEALRALSNKLAELQETERRHLARELHDEIGQALTGLRFVLESGREHGPNKIEEGLTIINDLIQQVHDLSLDLRPTVLDDLGLLPALAWYIERYSSQRSIKVNFKHRGLDRRFPPAIETAVYRIVQEGLTNISKYANVTTADVSIWTTNSTLEVQIEDSGVGFDVAKALTPPNSSGLVGMKERVALVGGVFTIDSAPMEGTRLFALLPLTQTGKEPQRDDLHSRRR